MSILWENFPLCSTHDIIILIYGLVGSFVRSYFIHLFIHIRYIVGYIFI